MSAEQRAKMLNRRKATVFQKSGQDNVTLFEQLKKQETSLTEQNQLGTNLVVKTMNDKKREEDEELSVNIPTTTFGSSKRKRRNNVELSLPGGSDYSTSPDKYTNDPFKRRSGERRSGDRDGHKRYISPDFDEIIIASQSHQIIKVKKKNVQDSKQSKQLEEYIQSIKYYIPKPLSQTVQQQLQNSNDLLKDLMMEYSSENLQNNSMDTVVFYELKPIEDILKSSSSTKKSFDNSSSATLNPNGSNSSSTSSIGTIEKSRSSGTIMRNKTTNRDLAFLMGKNKKDENSSGVISSIGKRLSAGKINIDLNFD
eukprot:gene6077-10085_t